MHVSLRRLSILISLLLTPYFAFSQGVAREYDFTIGLELKAHFRDSENVGFPTGIQPGDARLPPSLASVGFPPNSELRTVDPGSHFEVSVVSLFGELMYRDRLSVAAKVDFYDYHDRNPTTEDQDVDIDDFQVVFGKEVFENRLAEPGEQNVYLRLGKFGKMERQDDRHLESYGLVSTSFNRFEDQGIEVGMDITPSFYAKASYTAGNPVFIRDPNALAGDNGTGGSQRGAPSLNSGIVMLYDAEVEDLHFDEETAELGAAIGFRRGSEDGSRVINLMGFAYQRELDRSVDLEGTVYGGDLDIFDSPGPVTGQDGEVGLRTRGDDKKEHGANLWVYFDQTTLFAQLVEQKVAGLERNGWEIELVHFIQLPSLIEWREKPVLTDISPAIRYSHLDIRFPGNKDFPANSVAWDWERVDLGVRVGLIDGLDLTVEYAFNEFVRGGKDVGMDEVLSTLRYRRTL